MGNDQPTLRTLFACESGPYNIPKVRTLCHQNSYLVRVSVELHAFQMSYENKNYHFRALNHVLKVITTPQINRV